MKNSNRRHSQLADPTRTMADAAHLVFLGSMSFARSSQLKPIDYYSGIEHFLPPSSPFLHAVAVASLVFRSFSYYTYSSISSGSITCCWHPPEDYCCIANAHKRGEGEEKGWWGR